MSRIRLLILSLLSALMLSASWPPHGFQALLFVAWIPLFMLEEELYRRSAKATAVWGYSYITFLLWNILCTWWVYNASAGGAAMAIICNALLMSLVFTAYHILRRKIYFIQPLLLFSLMWIAFEWFHHNWELTWPWLTLGNAFAGTHTWVQWYEYTGIFGGSAWVLLVNSLIHQSLNSPKVSIRSLMPAVLAIVVPLAVSLGIYFTCNQQGETAEVVVVQPNIDPYGEKFGGMSSLQQLHKMLGLAEKQMTGNTKFLVFPETAITEDIWEDEIGQNQCLASLKKYLGPYPDTRIVIGASSYYVFKEGEELSATARRFRNGEGHYDAFNTAVHLYGRDSTVTLYHKSKLVPGVERMPYPALFGFLEKLSIDMGGTVGSLGTQQERTVFESPEGAVAVAPVICYESVFGEFITEYVANGAGLIFIITNDGWWGDTPGYKQHLLYGRLRAIETRRDIARSANTGISCFINQRGDIIQPTPWWREATIKASMHINNTKTFYVSYGDWLPALASIILLFVFVATPFRRMLTVKMK